MDASNKDNKETLPATPKPYTEIQIPEIELSWRSQVEAVDYLLSTLKAEGLDTTELLYSGVDGQPIKLNNSFGDRTETWGVDESTLRQAAVESDNNQNHSLNPLEYAKTAAEELPAIIGFDKTMFEEFDDYQWRLKPIHTMDQAAKAVVYLTH